MSVSEFEAMTGSTLAKPLNKLTLEFLLKIWRIDNKHGKATIEQNKQLYRKGAGNDLSKQFSTNNCMLRYSRINYEFYTDTFFTTSKAGKTTRQNTCA